MKTQRIGLSRTLSGKGQERERQAALSLRRQENSFFRFIENLDGQGFEFINDRTNAQPIS